MPVLFSIEKPKNKLAVDLELLPANGRKT